MSDGIWWLDVRVASEQRTELCCSIPPHFKELPAWIQTEATRGKAFLDVLRSVTDIDWTILSPSALFVEGERTGRFRLGGNELLTAANGKSWITYEDFSIALLDEVEQPKHIRERFTVGY